MFYLTSSMIPRVDLARYEVFEYLGNVLQLNLNSYLLTRRTLIILVMIRLQAQHAACFLIHFCQTPEPQCQGRSPAALCY